MSTRVTSHKRKGTKGVKTHSRNVSKVGTVPHTLDDEILVPEKTPEEEKEEYVDLLQGLLFSFFQVEKKREPVRELVKFDEAHNTALIKHIETIIPLEDYKPVGLNDFTIKKRDMDFEGKKEVREYYGLEDTGFDKVEIDQFVVLDSMDNHQIYFKKDFPLIIKSIDNDYSILRAPIELK